MLFFFIKCAGGHFICAQDSTFQHMRTTGFVYSCDLSLTVSYQAHLIISNEKSVPTPLKMNAERNLLSKLHTPILKLNINLFPFFEPNFGVFPVSVGRGRGLRAHLKTALFRVRKNKSRKEIACVQSWRSRCLQVLDKLPKSLAPMQM